MASEDLRVRISAIVQGLDAVESLKNAVRQVQTTAAPAAADLQKLKNAATQLGSATGRTENDLRRSINALRDVRSQVSLADGEYRRLTATINKYQAQLDRATGAQQRGGRALQFAQTAGAVAASGVFGGPEGLVGAGIGAFFGPGGALAGGAIGAQVSMLRQQLGQTADFAAQIDRLKIALKGVTQGAAEYEAALAVVNRATKTFNVTKDEAISGFTKLTAAVVGSGGKVRDAELVFNGISAAVRATGGSAEDVQGALVAMAQVFSKGKVSAEELQGQLGERLPGAVAMFAKATGRTGPELAKALEQGTVGLNDLMKFVIALGDRFSATNEKIAKSSEASGDRMKVAFATLREEVGRTLQPLGASLQNLAAGLAETAAQMVVAARNSSELNAALAEATKNSSSAAKALAEMQRTSMSGVDGGLGDAILQAASGTGELEKRLRQNDTQLQASITRFYEAEGAVTAHKKALLASGMTLDEQGKAVNAAEGALTILEGRLRTLAAQNKSNTKEAEFYRAKVADLKGVLESVKGTYRAKIEIQQIFKGQGSQVQRDGKTSLPEGYRIVAGRLAYQVPGIGWVDAQTGKPVFQGSTTPNRGQSTFSDPKTAGSGKDAEAEKLAAKEQQLQEDLAKNAIQLDNERHKNRLEFLRKEFEYAQELEQRRRDLWANSFVGKGSESARALSDLFSRFDGYKRTLFDSQQNVQASRQGFSSAQSLERVTSQGLSAGSRRLNVGTLKGLAAAAGFNDRDASIMAAIAMAESGGNSASLNNNPRTGDLSYGLWQVNMLGRMGPERRRSFGIGSNDALYDPGTNAMAARKIYESQGFGAWSVYRSGAYRQYLPGAMRATAKAPAGMFAQTRRDVSAEGRVAVSAEQVQQQEALNKLEENRVAALKSFDWQGFNQQLTKGLKEQNQALSDSVSDYRLKAKYEAMGMRPELIDAEMKKNELIRERNRFLEPLQQALQSTNDPKTQAKLAEAIQGVNDLYAEQADLVDGLARAQTAQGTALAAYLGQMRQQFAEMTNFENVMIQVGQTVEQSISTAMSSAVTSVVTGTGSVQQALANMFQSIGQAFVQMAAEIIAKQLVMITLQTILKALGAVGSLGSMGSSGGFGSWSGGSFGVDKSGLSLPGLDGAGALKDGGGFYSGVKFANGGVMTSNGPMPLKRYARGGIADRPQMALFGEGSQPEAYVPLPDGRRIPVAMQAPANNNGRMRDLMGAAPTQGASSPVLNMSFETTKIGGVEYVSRDQLEAAMAETRRAASRDGARRGMTMTLDKLQQSPSTRSRVGLR